MIKVIKFYADWCGPCSLYAKIFDKVSKELTEANHGENKIEFININVEKDTSGLAAKYKVTSIPMTVVIKNGEEKSSLGLLQENALKGLILDE